MQLSDVNKAIFNTLHEGVLIIDNQGRIVFANSSYCNFINLKAEDITGQLLREARPGARLPDVLITKQPMLHAPRKEGDEDIYFVNMYPILANDNSVIGGISIVTFIKEAYDFRKELERYEQRSQQVLKRVNKAGSSRYSFDSITAVSANSRAVKDLAMRISKTDATVLLESDSGTGKELYAQAIHNNSNRKDGVFVAINCANFNANMLESELFGYVEGAFTGAKKGGKIGLFEAAEGGTVFLDEISELDLGLQSKLLRALQERRIRPVGGVNEITVDVRVIAACNANLQKYVEEGKFRKDLYYRLNVCSITIPPLKERLEDIPHLVKSILQELSVKLKHKIEITPQATVFLQKHDWPGNVRELHNVLEFSAYLSENGVITQEALPSNILKSKNLADNSTSLSQRLKKYEIEEIERTLKKYPNSLSGKKAAAKELKISLSTLYSKLQSNISEKQE